MSIDLAGMSPYDGVFVPTGDPDERRQAVYDLVSRIIVEDPTVADWLPDAGDWADPAALAGEILPGVGRGEILAVAWSHARIVVVVAGSTGGVAHHVPRPAWIARMEHLDYPGAYVAALLRRRPGPGTASPATRGDGLVEFGGLLCRPEVVDELRDLFGPHHARRAAEAIARDFRLTYKGPLRHPNAGSRKTGKGREVSWATHGPTVIVTVIRPGRPDYSVEWRAAPGSSPADPTAYGHAAWRGGAEARPGADRWQQTI